MRDCYTSSLAVDDRTLLVDARELVTPTITFGAFDESGRLRVVYPMQWGLPRA